MKPCLEEMPIHVKELIIDKTDLASRFTLRKVNKEFYWIIDSSLHIASNYKEIKFAINDFGVTLTLKTDKKLSVTYEREKKGCEVVTKKSRVFIAGKGHVERAVLDFATLLKNPNFSVKKLSVSIYFYYKVTAHRYGPDRNSFKRCMSRELANLGRQIIVEEVARCDHKPDILMSYLPYIAPGSLRKFTFHEQVYNDVWRKVYATDQWNAAKELWSKSKVPLGELDFAHFEKATVFYVECAGNELKELIEELLEMKSLVHIKLVKCQYEQHRFEEYLERFEDAKPGDSTLKIIKDPNSEYSFLCLVKPSRIEFYAHGYEYKDKDEEEDSDFEDYVRESSGAEDSDTDDEN